MAEEEGSWDATLTEWVVVEHCCYAAALAQKEDCQFYAAGPAANEEGWGHVFKEDHEEEILQDDGETKKKTMINEASTLKALIDTGRAPLGGLWLGGHKYTVTQCDPKFEDEDNLWFWAFAARPKGGVHIVCTDSQVVVGFYDEEKGMSSGNCKKTVLTFAGYLKSVGY